MKKFKIFQFMCCLFFCSCVKENNMGSELSHSQEQGSEEKTVHIDSVKLGLTDSEILLILGPPHITRDLSDGITTVWEYLEINVEGNAELELAGLSVYFKDSSVIFVSPIYSDF